MLRAVDTFEKLGAVRDVERVMELLQQIDLDADELDDDGEVFTTVVNDRPRFLIYYNWRC